MADLAETLTSLQEAIFLGAVVCLNRTEHGYTVEPALQSGRKNSAEAVYPGRTDDRRHPETAVRRRGCRREGD